MFLNHSHLNLYLPGITVFIGFLLFVPNPGDIWMMLDCMVTQYWTQHIVCLWKKTCKISKHDLNYCTLNFPPPWVPLSPSGQMSSWYRPCWATTYPYRHGCDSWSCSLHLLLPIAATYSPHLFSAPPTPSLFNLSSILLLHCLLYLQTKYRLSKYGN